MNSLIPKTFKMWDKKYHLIDFVKDTDPKIGELCVYKNYSKVKKRWYFHVEQVIDLVRTLDFIKESNKGKV